LKKRADKDGASGATQVDHLKLTTLLLILSNNDCSQNKLQLLFDLYTQDSSATDAERLKAACSGDFLMAQIAASSRSVPRDILSHKKLLKIIDNLLLLPIVVASTGDMATLQ